MLGGWDGLLRLGSAGVRGGGFGRALSLRALYCEEQVSCGSVSAGSLFDTGHDGQGTFICADAFEDGLSLVRWKLTEQSEQGFVVGRCLGQFSIPALQRRDAQLVGLGDVDAVLILALATRADRTKPITLNG